MGGSGRKPAGIGFRIRTGNTTAVMLGAPVAAPRFLAREYVPLIDMNDDEARQPYHVVAEQDEERGMMLVGQTMEAATARAAGTTRGLIDRARGSDFDVRGAILVVGSDTNPASIRQPHVRAHSLEGRLYRVAVECALSQLKLASQIIVERDAFRTAEDTLGKSRAQLTTALGAFGKVAGRPWRLQDKAAALAAWMALDLR
jgi:hypothetical protein